MAKKKEWHAAPYIGGHNRLLDDMLEAVRRLEWEEAADQTIEKMYAAKPIQHKEEDKKYKTG